MPFDFNALLLEEISDAIVAKSPEGRVIYWSRGAERVFGYTSEEAVGHLLSELIIPPNRKDEESRILLEVQGRDLSQYETTRRKKDGSLIYVDVSSKLVHPPEGQAAFILSTNKDVTHLKVLRDAKLAEARYGNLLESTPDGIIMANPAGRVVLANSQAEALFGYERGELLGQPIEVLLPQRFRQGHVGHRAQFFEHPRTRSMGAGLELFGLRKDQTEIPVEISLSPIETDQGTLVMSAIRDISDRKRIEKALQEKNVELEAAAESKNRFLANMSHELRTPLNGIIGFAEFLSDGKPGPMNPKQKEYLGDILNSGRHLLQLINDVLDLAKVEANKMDLHPEKFSLEKAIEGICSVAKPMAQKKRIQVRTTVAPELGEVELDSQKFKQVLYNLLSNAIKFTDDEGAVDIQAIADREGYFKLSVRDTGIGIRAEDFPRLFTEFEQLESGAGRRYEGTGLGLALTRRIVELQGGTISVESEVGRGSTFSVVLPRGDPQP